MRPRHRGNQCSHLLPRALGALALLAMSPTLPVAAQPVWGDEHLSLALIGDRLQVSVDGAVDAAQGWTQSAEFLARARSDDAESAQMVWIDPARRAIALVDSDRLELRWLSVQGDVALDSRPLPASGHRNAALVWPEACELPVLRLDYPEGHSILVAASAKGALQQVQRAGNLEELPSPLVHSERLVAGAFTRGGAGIRTWLWWYQCASPEGESGQVALEFPLVQPVVTAGVRTLLVHDLQWPHGRVSPAPLYRIDVASGALEQLAPCPVGAQPADVLGSPDARPLRLRCWTGGNSPSAKFEVEH